MISSLHWVPQVFGIELKKAFTYRFTFWVQFIMGTGTELAVAYFVWKSIFSYSSAQELQGFSFNGLVYYSLFASAAGKITKGAERGYFSQEIYDGTLTRYLLYPLPIFLYKFVTHLAQQLLGTVQMLIAFFLVWVFMGMSGGETISLASFCAGILTCIIAGYLHFVLVGCLEMVAFWQDIIWNLMAMLKFCMILLGGGLLPLTFFPQWAQAIVQYTPFPALISFPARTFLGNISLQDWFFNLGVVLIWSVITSFLLLWLWRKGTRQYSGVGL